jgi:hypothetical protein
LGRAEELKSRHNAAHSNRANELRATDRSMTAGDEKPS